MEMLNLLKKISFLNLMETNRTKERLRKKLKNKNPSTVDGSDKIDEDNLFTMLNQVNKMLKQNPNMVKKVSKCVNSIFENKELMESLVSEIQTNVTPDQDPESQTLQSNSEGQERDASENESVQ
jgi:hypothetical protein